MITGDNALTETEFITMNEQANESTNEDSGINAAAPESAPAETAKPKREAVSTKIWLDSAGAPVTRLEDALALRYTTNSTKTIHEYDATAEIGTRGCMCELFGIKTKLTNVASTARQQGDDEDTAIALFIEGLMAEQAVWRELKEGTTAATKYDKDVIAQVMHDAALLQEESPEWIEAGRKAQSVAEYLEKLSKRGMVVKVMNMPTIRAAYDDAMGTDDEAAMDSVL